MFLYCRQQILSTLRWDDFACSQRVGNYSEVEVLDNTSRWYTRNPTHRRREVRRVGYFSKGCKHQPSGAHIHTMRYIQPPKLPQSRATRKMMRIKVGSRLKYSAKPPQTPAILRSFRLRKSFLGWFSIIFQDLGITLLKGRERIGARPLGVLFKSGHGLSTGRPRWALCL